jgi:hypothetical protein
VFSTDDEFDDLTEQFGGEHTRAFIVVDVDRVSDSCGYGVPLMTFEGNRGKLERWADKMGEDGLARYRAAHNRAGLDGLPGVPEDADTVRAGEPQ